MSRCVHILFLGLALLAPLAGCDTETPRPPFSIRPILDTSAAGSCLGDFSDYELTCGAALSLRVIDTESSTVLASSCVHVPPAGTLEGLKSAAPPPFFDLPPNRLRIEVGLWPSDVLTNEAPNCPDRLFRPGGGPNSTPRPEPAFSGSAVFDAGNSDDIAYVPLACNKPAQLSGCVVQPTSVVVPRVLNIDTLERVNASNARLTVSVGQPQPSPDSPSPEDLRWRISNPLPLDPHRSPRPAFSATFDRRFDGTLCAVVREDIPEATSAVVCKQVTGDETHIEFDNAAYLPRAVLNRILTAADLTEFPDVGLVIGRVVDHRGRPLSRVSVNPDLPEKTRIEYLSDEEKELSEQGHTSGNGYFLAREVPFGTDWFARHVDGQAQLSVQRAGLIENRLTLVVIEMDTRRPGPRDNHPGGRPGKPKRAE